jgi:uncharacterized membrane protein
MTTPTDRGWILWLFPAAYLVFLVVYLVHPSINPAIASTFQILLIAAFAVIHGLKRYSLRNFAIFALITIIVSNIYENISVLTGFPFGNYTYADSLGPKLFFVPVLIAPTYFATGYLSWTLAAVLLGVFDRQRSRKEAWVQPLVASFIMVMWDLTMDPISSTIEGLWTWHDGGGYFGVPFENFTGWLLCTFTFFLLFSVHMNRRIAATATRPAVQPGAYWNQASAMYALLGLAHAILVIVGPRQTVTDPAGQVWQTGQIYQSLTLVTIFTMGFVALLSVLLVGAWARRAPPSTE